MKKLILSICLVIAIATIANAQQGQGGGFNSPERMAQMKQTLKDSLQLTDVQADSVMSIQQAYQPKTREIRQDQNMTDAEKQEKMKLINEERNKRFEKALGAELGQKVVAYYSRMQGRGRRPAGQ